MTFFTLADFVWFCALVTNGLALTAIAVKFVLAWANNSKKKESSNIKNKRLMFVVILLACYGLMESTFYFTAR